MNTVLSYLSAGLFMIIQKKYCTLYLCYNVCKESSDLYANPKEKLVKYASDSFKSENITNTIYQLIYNGILVYLTIF